MVVYIIEEELDFGDGKYSEVVEVHLSEPKAKKSILFLEEGCKGDDHISYYCTRHKVIK